MPAMSALRARTLPQAERTYDVARIWRPRRGGGRIIAAAPVRGGVVAGLDTGEVQATPFLNGLPANPVTLPAELGPIAAVAPIPSSDDDGAAERAVVVASSGCAAVVNMGDFKAYVDPAWERDAVTELGRTTQGNGAGPVVTSPLYTVVLSTHGTLSAMGPGAPHVVAAQRVLGPVVSMMFVDPDRMLVLNAFGDLSMWDIGEDHMLTSSEGALREAIRCRTGCTLSYVRGHPHPVLLSRKSNAVGGPVIGTLYHTLGDDESITFFSISPCGRAMAVATQGADFSILDLVDLSTRHTLASLASYPNDAWVHVAWPVDTPGRCVALTRIGDAYLVKVPLADQ